MNDAAPADTSVVAIFEVLLHILGFLVTLFLAFTLATSGRLPPSCSQTFLFTNVFFIAIVDKVRVNQGCNKARGLLTTFGHVFEESLVPVGYKAQAFLCEYFKSLTLVGYLQGLFYL